MQRSVEEGLVGETGFFKSFGRVQTTSILPSITVRMLEDPDFFFSFLVILV